MKIEFTFSAIPFQYSGKGAWYFVSLPIDMSTEIRETFRSEEEGWGRLKASAKIGNTEWQTAIWFDTKLNTYLLPVKAEVRKKEKVGVVEAVEVRIYI